MNGLRVRLATQKRVYRLGEDVVFRLEFHNVSVKTIAIDAPELLPIISAPGDHPFNEDHGFNTVLSAKPIDQAISIFWAKQKVHRRVLRSIQLLPDGKLSVAVRGRVDPRDQRKEEKEVVKDAVEVRARGEELPHRLERNFDLRFAFGDCTGKFRLTAQYNSTDRIGGFRIEFPPIDIEIRPPEN